MAQALWRALRGFRGLVSLLTTLPVGQTPLADAAKMFYTAPLMGFMEGLLIALPIYILAVLYVDTLVIGALYVLAHLLLTGGIHLDGFSDYSDVLFSRASGSRAHAILKDPRRGSFAIIAVAANVSISLASISALSSAPLHLGGLNGFIMLTTVVCIVYIASAESMFLVLSFAPPEPYEGMARVFSIEASRLKARLLNFIIYLATLLALSIPLVLTVGVEGLALTFAPTLPLQILLTLLVVRDSRLRLGFANGDVAGFTFELVRMLSLVFLAVVLGWYLRL